jgi:aminoglycoside phosphotransferase (APT) family kinase protein
VHNISEMPSRLAAFLAAEEPGWRDIEVTSYEVMTGGYSRLLAKATVRHADGEHTFVLRGDPPPDKQLISTDRALEWDVLSTVHGHGVRVSVPRYFDATGDRLGTKALVLEFCQATSLLPYLAGATEHEHRDAAERLAEAAAAFHRIPLDSLPARLDRPESWDAYIGHRIDEWRRTADAHVESLPILRFVAAWLEAHRPTPVPLTLIHGDFQSSNLMRDADGGIVVLDWELAQIGDPREDLGYFKAVAQAAGPDLTGIDADAFCLRYRELAGLTEEQMNPLVLAYFLILGVVGTVRQLLEGGAAFARGENSLLNSLFSMSSVMFGQMMWLQATRQLDQAFEAAKGA